MHILEAYKLLFVMFSVQGHAIRIFAQVESVTRLVSDLACTSQPVSTICIDLLCARCVVKEELSC